MSRVLMTVLAFLLMFAFSPHRGHMTSAPTEHTVTIQTEAPAEQTVAAPSEAPTDRPESGSETGTAGLTVDYAGEALLARTDAYDEFIDDASEYQVKVVLNAETPLSDFKYMEIRVTDIDESGTPKFELVREIYTAAELSPARPLVIGMVFVGLLPDRGISYTDADGSTKYFYISMSGKDGSLLLTEFITS